VEEFIAEIEHLLMMAASLKPLEWLHTMPDVTPLFDFTPWVETTTLRPKHPIIM